MSFRSKAMEGWTFKKLNINIVERSNGAVRATELY